MPSKKIKFKKRYVLGCGYPWSFGLGPYTSLCMRIGPYATVGQVELKFPVELWSRELPKYDLVLIRRDK